MVLDGCSGRFIISGSVLRWVVLPRVSLFIRLLSVSRLVFPQLLVKGRIDTEWDCQTDVVEIWLDCRTDIVLWSHFHRSSPHLTMALESDEPDVRFVSASHGSR